MRAIWSGSISFGLVNIPVRLYSATATESKVEFDLLHKKDMSPIRYAKVCKVEGEEVPNDEIVKGFEYEDGQYVIMTDDDFQRAHPAITQTIEVTGFTSEVEIDDIYFEKPYYLEPDKGAAKAYTLFREALKRSGKVGIARFIMRNREHMAAIKPSGDVLVLDQLRYHSDIHKPDELKLPSSENVVEAELELAMALVDKLTMPFKPEEYKDTYSDELHKVIEEKAAGRVPVAQGEAPTPTDVTDLISALKKSLEKENRPAA